MPAEDVVMHAMVDSSAQRKAARRASALLLARACARREFSFNRKDNGYIILRSRGPIYS